MDIPKGRCDVKLWVYDVCWALASVFVGDQLLEGMSYAPGFVGSVGAWMLAFAIFMICVFRLRRWAAR